MQNKLFAITIALILTIGASGVLVVRARALRRSGVGRATG